MANNSRNSLKRFFSPNITSKKKGKTNQEYGDIFEDKQEKIIEELLNDSDNEQRSIKKTHERKKPNQNWFKIYPWLKQEVIDNKIILFCSLCRDRRGKTVFAIGTTTYRLENLKNHIKTNEHKESEDLAKPQQTKIIINFAKQLGIDKLNIISLMRNVYFCSKKYQAINIFSDLSKLVNLQIKNNKEYIISDKTSILKKPEFEKNSTKSSYGSYMNSNAGNEFLESICCIIEDELFEELNNSKFWSIMIDESNTIVDNKHLAIVSKHLINNIPYMRYLGMINLEETDASYIFNQMKSFISLKNLNINSLIHFGSDGAATMIGNFYFLF